MLGLLDIDAGAYVGSWVWLYAVVGQHCSDQEARERRGRRLVGLGVVLHHYSLGLHRRHCLIHAMATQPLRH